MFAPLSADDASTAPAAPAAASVVDFVPTVPMPGDHPQQADCPLFKHPKLGQPVAVWLYRDGAGQPEGYVCRFDLVDEAGNPVIDAETGKQKKEFRPFRHGTKPGRNGKPWTAFFWQGWKDSRPLYRLPELLADTDKLVFITEGEKKADAVPVLFPDAVGVSPMNGAKSPSKTDWAPLAGRRVIISTDNDEAGLSFGDEVYSLLRQAGVTEISHLRPDRIGGRIVRDGEIVSRDGGCPSKYDLADALKDGFTAGHIDSLRTAPGFFTPYQDAKARKATAAAVEAETLDEDAEIARLASLPAITYEREREAAAKRLGVRTSVLDKLVKAVVNTGSDSDTKGQGQALELPSPEPWGHPVNGAALLSEMTAGVRKYMVMEDGAAEAVALWVVHAHTVNAFGVSPRLAITSPEKQCGKTTCLDVVASLVPRPLTTANATAAAIFRTIEAAQPTLMIDEADTFLTDNDEMRGILNSGHRRSAAFVLRLVGDDHEPRKFSTWAATVIAMIGRLPDTLEDRSIPVRLRRRRPDEAIKAFRVDRTADLDLLARKVARWAADNHDNLKGMDPVIPPTINNRAADNWRPLLAIADAAGGEWPARARRIAEMVVAGAGADVQSAKVMLLEDIRSTFEDKHSDRLPSADLVAALVEMEGRPWCEWKAGRPITQNTLARLLAPFNIAPGNLRAHGQVSKGYRLEQFSDSFTRYVPKTPCETATPLQTAETQGFQAKIEPLHNRYTDECSGSNRYVADCEGGCSGSENPATPQETAICSGVADETPFWEGSL